MTATHPEVPPLPQAFPLPEIQDLQIADLASALRAGLRDFRAAPLYGLFFSGVYVLAGLALISLGAGAFTWTLVLSLGFPLVGPFLAVGLYEVSRRRAEGVPFGPVDILSVVWRERTRQVPWAGGVIVIYFLFWTFLAHMIFALFMGPQALMTPPDDWRTYLSGAGLAMVGAELVLGGALAFLLFALTVVALPMLLEKEIDFVSAMRLSLRTTRHNLPVMMVWAAVIASTTLIALIPWFLGLFAVLPLLAHASWHLYRRALL